MEQADLIQTGIAVAGILVVLFSLWIFIKGIKFIFKIALSVGLFFALIWIIPPAREFLENLL